MFSRGINLFLNKTKVKAQILKTTCVTCVLPVIHPLSPLAHTLHNHLLTAPNPPGSIYEEPTVFLMCKWRPEPCEDQQPSGWSFMFQTLFSVKRQLQAARSFKFELNVLLTQGGLLNFFFYSAGLKGQNKEKGKCKWSALIWHYGLLLQVHFIVHTSLNVQFYWFDAVWHCWLNIIFHTNIINNNKNSTQNMFD